MQKQYITVKQAVSILFLLVMGSALVMGISTKAEQDSWISLILASAAVIPLGLLYARLMRLNPGLDLFEILRCLFGPIAGKIILFLYTMFALHIGALTMRGFGEFVETVAMPETPQYPVYLILGVMAAYVVISGVSTFGKCALAIAPVSILILIFTTLTSAKDFDFSNLLPVLNGDFLKVSAGTFSIITMPYAEIVLFLAIASAIRPKDNPYKIYSYGILLGSVNLLIILVKNILFIGFPVLASYNYPSYSASRIVTIGMSSTFLRIESLISCSFILTTFIRTSVCLFAASKGLSALFNINRPRVLVVPTTLIMTLLAAILYSNLSEMVAWNEVYKYYALPFEVFFPITALAIAEWKHHKKKNALLPST